MSGIITSPPHRSLSEARLMVADTSGHDAAQVFDACDVLERHGSRADQIRARALRTALLAGAIQCHGDRQPTRHRIALLSDVLGVLALFGLLFLFLLFTPA
jgi:hypothetical protein